MRDVMTPSEVAELLRINVRTVYKLAAEGVLPGSRIGRSWRFNRNSILALISKPPTRSISAAPSPTEKRKARARLPARPLKRSTGGARGDR